MTWQADVRTLRLVREEDMSGVSGTGIVAVGVMFPTGRVVLEWLDTTKTGIRSLGIYGSIDEVVVIHGHGGATTVVWNDATA